MEKKLTILIGWHNESDPIKVAAYEENKKSFELYNPDLTIISVLNSILESREAWLGTDISLFSWYINHGEANDSERYLFVEWDWWCDVNIEEYFKRVWDCDVVGPCIKYPERYDWDWFNTIDELPYEARVHATGIMPFCGILLSNKAMKLI